MPSYRENNRRLCVRDCCFDAQQLQSNEDTKESDNTAKLRSHCAIIHLNRVPCSIVPRQRQSTRSAKATPVAQGIISHSMDIGSAIFLRTKRRLFYINECSVGLSSDVIERTERFKRIKWLSLFGGFVVFFCAAVVTLVKLAPVPMRMRLFRAADSAASAPVASVNDPCEENRVSGTGSLAPPSSLLWVPQEPSPFLSNGQQQQQQPYHLRNGKLGSCAIPSILQVNG